MRKFSAQARVNSTSYQAMTFLEFIRKNSLLVLIVIVAIGAGLLMMDYSGQGSAFSRDFHIQVNGTNYKSAEVYSLGENGSATIQRLLQASYSKLRERFDSNGDDNLSEDESAAMEAWLREHPEVDASMSRLQSVLQAWCYGICKHSEENVAINRAILREEAEALGIRASKDQVDAFIISLPAFTKADGSFDQQLYQDLTGYHNGVANNPAEQAFREAVADIIIWESITALVTNGISYHTPAQRAIIDASSQSISGRTAWLAKDKVQAPAEPTEEELAAHWEANKERYKSEQRRIVSIYTLTPAEGVSIDDLMATANVIEQELAMADGAGIDNILSNVAAAGNAENSEYAAFTYLLEDGSSHVTTALSTEAEAPAVLQTKINADGRETTLAAVAFGSVECSTSVADYEAAVQNKTTEKLGAWQQMRGFFAIEGNKAVLIDVEAVEPPTVLPFEAARERALADLKAERTANALQIAAEKLYAEMSEAVTAGENLDAVFAKATAAGAEVSNFGPTSMGINAELPEGLSTQALIVTPSGKLCQLTILPTGARISAVTERTVPADQQYVMLRDMFQVPMTNSQLTEQIMQDWINSAYIRYNVQLADYVSTNSAN